jgi:hypothetical protein
MFKVPVIALPKRALKKAIGGISSAITPRMQDQKKMRRLQLTV